MVGIGNADVRGRIGSNIGNNVLINETVIGIQLELDLDIGVDRLKIGNRFSVDALLGGVVFVFCPEGDLVIPRGIKRIGNSKGFAVLRAVTARKRGQQ
jgi:hypothetical protein